MYVKYQRCTYIRKLVAFDSPPPGRVELVVPKINIDTLTRKPHNSVLEFFTENQVMFLPIVKFRTRHHGNTEICLHCTQVDHTRKYVLVILGHFS